MAGGSWLIAHGTNCKSYFVPLKPYLVYFLLDAKPFYDCFEFFPADFLLFWQQSLRGQLNEGRALAAQNIHLKKEGVCLKV